MRAFDVRLNGKRACVAGVGRDGVVSVIVDHVAGNGGQRLHLTVGGLRSDPDEYVTWKSTPLRVGDEVRLKIIEVDSVDRPRTRKRMDPKQEERNSKAYMRKMAKKFGWKLVKMPRRTP